MNAMSEIVVRLNSVAQATPLNQGTLTQDKSERSPLLARRGGCGVAADGVVGQARKTEFADMEQPPRRFAPPLLARRGDRSDLPNALLSFDNLKRTRFQV